MGEVAAGDLVFPVCNRAATSRDCGLRRCDTISHRFLKHYWWLSEAKLPGVEAVTDKCTGRYKYDDNYDDNRRLVWRWADRLLNTHPLDSLGLLARWLGHSCQANKHIKL